MGVVSAKELPQTFEREVGRPAVIKRRWVCVLSDDTLANNPATEIAVVAAAFGVSESALANSTIFGAPHPRLGAWLLRKLTLNEGFEGSPYHVEVIGEYGIVREEELITPVGRPAVWEFEAGSAQVPALYYYDGSGNGTMYPLTNSAYDYFPGLMVEESIVRSVVKKNFAAFPSSWYAANNFVNNSSYLGCALHTIKVSGVATSYVYEEFGGTMVKYWAATATLVYRQSGHNLQLPDIGWNYIDGGQKRRAMVFDFQNGEWVASPNPVGLNGSGAQTGGQPAILNRRVNPETNFSTLFGTPPP